jgi:hypothetical protein
MGTSAFDLLVLPVFIATFGAMVAVAAYLGLMNAAEILIGRWGHMIRMARPRPTVLRVVHIRPELARHRVAIRPTRLVG